MEEELLPQKTPSSEPKDPWRERPKWTLMGSSPLALLGRFFYALTGWKCVGKSPTRAKYVVIAAPHTSNWDGFHLLCAAAILRLRFSYFGKDTLFVGPLGLILRATGGMPLDRSKNQGLVAQAVAKFDESETFAMGVAPEGTRQYTPGWKTGFYYIALEAHVPVLLGFIDYSRKEAGLLDEVLVPTGDIKRDFEILARLYADKAPRHPQKRGPVVPLSDRSSA